VYAVYVYVWMDQGRFGEWMKHSSGFGLKMMQSLGYTRGDGLGKSGQGISEPVAAAKV